MDALPDWVNQFNNINWSDSLMPNGWNTLYPIDTYAQSDKDDKNYEKTFSGEAKPVFPHRKASLTSTPFGNTLTLDFARAAIEGYKLGKGNFTDMLTISLSSPDRIGHRFGPNSIEEEDDYLRLDKDLAKFFNYLDNRFGKDGYLFFLTADHGVDQSPGYLKEHNIPSGVLNVKKIVKDVNTALQKRYGLTNIILSVTDGQVYLNYNVLAKNKLDRLEVAKFVAAQLKKEPGIKNAFAAEMLGTATLTEPIKSMYINGYNPKRSGDVLVIWSAGWKPGSPKGAEHGNWYPYDAHIPLVWMGWGVPHGETHRNIGMTDIAPTIAALLHIQMPSGSIGKVITEFVDRQD
jgi:predicted AlkP superfamily pyrophosphatase or phosphodiesterase